jgi:hypothetical protein
MQIDGHHTATFVAARIAGFSPDEAGKIAYAAQYVDDATNAGIVRFTNSDYMYSRIASAHRMIDYENFVDMANHLAWIPFHFLPGNGGLPKGSSPKGGDIQKLICKPDSYIARDMLSRALTDRGSPRELHRLGIAMHVYADTFVHQGFIGAQSELNQVNELVSRDDDADSRIKTFSRFELAKDFVCEQANSLSTMRKAIGLSWKEKKWVVSLVYDFLKKKPLGHAGADTFPDQPYLNWSYRDSKGELIHRDNPYWYLLAMDMMVRAMRAWRVGDSDMKLELQNGMCPSDRSVVETLFRNQRSVDGEERRKAWLNTIERGLFSFGKSTPPIYIAKGAGSWKEAALDTLAESDGENEAFPYKAEFLASDWKLFHDALQVHRSDVVHGILPQYGICAA